jgi:DNA-directed RNA polymerase alpha subunit
MRCPVCNAEFEAWPIPVRFNFAEATNAKAGRNYNRARYTLLTNRARDTKIAEHFETQLLTLKELAAAHGVTRTTIQSRIYHAQQEREREAKYREALAVCSFLDFPLDVLDLTVRTRGCLHNEGCNTVGEALRLSDAELLRCPNFGRVSLFELHHRLNVLRDDIAATAGEVAA